MSAVKIILMNTPLLGVMIFITAAVLSALLCYAVTRKFLKPYIKQDSEMLTARMVALLGSLHALILALMFAQEMADYRDISRIVAKEASAINDVYSNLQEYGGDSPEATTVIRNLLVDYVNTVLEENPVALTGSTPGRETWVNYHRINRLLRGLQADNNDQEDLRTQMLTDWDNVSEFHLRLRTIAKYEAPGFFWIVILSGFIAVVIPCYVYSPSIANLTILGTYAAFNGIVMYVIFSIGNPLSGALAINTNTLGDLMSMLRSTTL